jgi:hypothetical protein
MRSLSVLHVSWKATLAAMLLLALPAWADTRIGLGVEVFTESSRLTGQQSINAARRDEMFVLSSRLRSREPMLVTVPEAGGDVPGDGGRAGAAGDADSSGGGGGGAGAPGCTGSQGDAGPPAAQAPVTRRLKRATTSINRGRLKRRSPRLSTRRRARS